MQSIINNIVNNASGNLEIQADEYIKDDLIYCKNCNGKRSLYFINPITNEKKIVRCICDCQAKAQEEEIRKEEELKRLKEVEKLKVASLMGDRYKNVSFANTEIGHNNSFDTAFIRCKRYCEVSREVLKKGLGIYIYGSTGSGKTHLTSCIANELMNQMFQVVFTSFGKIAKMIQDSWKTKESENELINRLGKIDFLFIDDLGTERTQKNDEDLWIQEIIYEVLNTRYNNNKPTIFTSNHSLQELINERGVMQKTIDRIAEMSSAIFKIEGESYRLKKREQVEIPF